MAVNKANTETRVEPLTDEQRIAQMEMEAQKRADEILAEAEKARRDAEAILANAKLTAASIPTAPAANFDKEISAAAKLSLTARMRRQFGEDVELVTFAIPLDTETRNMTLTATVNGISYEFTRGEVYEMAKPLYQLILESYNAGNIAENSEFKL